MTFSASAGAGEPAWTADEAERAAFVELSERLYRLVRQRVGLLFGEGVELNDVPLPPRREAGPQPLGERLIPGGAPGRFAAFSQALDVFGSFHHPRVVGGISLEDGQS